MQEELDNEDQTLNLAEFQNPPINPAQNQNQNVQPFDPAQSGQQNFGNPPTYNPPAYNPGQFAAFNHQQYGQTSFASPPPSSSGQQF